MKKAQLQRIRRHKKISERARSSSSPRLSVFRSSQHIYATLLDENTGKAIFSVSDKILTDKKTKTEKAREVGKQFAQKAKKNSVTKIVFDRGGYLYHGRVKALAEGAREGGLEF